MFFSNQRLPPPLGNTVTGQSGLGGSAALQ
jgi:hypothetical protein